MMRLLLAYDASTCARDAAGLVESLPLPDGSVIRVVFVLEPSIMASPWAAPMLLGGVSLEPEARVHLEGELRDVGARLREATGARVDGVVLAGRPATVLVEDGRGFGADLVILGSRGHGALASLLLGSVSAEVADHSSCPVLVARGTSIARVLLATDDSASARHVEDLVARWPVFTASVIRVVSVAEVVHPWHTGIAPTMYRQVSEAYARDLDAATARHRSIASDAAGRLQAAGRQADPVVRVGDAAAEIVAEAGEWGADVILVGSRGQTGLTRLVTGSVARNVLMASTVSVLVSRIPGYGA